MQKHLFSHSQLSIRRANTLFRTAIIGTFLVIGLGGLVRATGSGLACPDWPKCFGELIPAFDVQIFIEWFHRLMAGSLGLFTICIFGYVLLSASLRTLLVKPLTMACVLLALQITLGGLTVLKLLDPKIVSFHLLTALLFYSVLVWCFYKTTYKNRALRDFQHLTRWRLIGMLLLTATFIQITLGSLVSSNYAGLVCNDFPKCNGMWFPTDHFYFIVHISHRYFGMGLLLLVSLAVLYLHISKKTAPQDFTQILTLYAICMLLQSALGVINIVYAIPVWSTVLHLANGVFCYTLVLIANIHLHTSTGKETLAVQTRSTSLYIHEELA